MVDSEFVFYSNLCTIAIMRQEYLFTRTVDFNVGGAPVHLTTSMICGVHPR